MKILKPLISACLLFILSGCATLPQTNEQLSGEYKMGGFNSETTLNLFPEGKYQISQWTMSCLVGENGETESWIDEEIGSWSHQNGLLFLHSSVEEQREYYTWFSRLRISKKNGNTILIGDVKESPFFGHTAFEKTEKTQISATRLKGSQA